MLKRNHVINFRVSDTELQAIRKEIAQSRCSAQAYLFNAVMGAKIMPPETAEQLKKLNHQLSNLIQIIRGIATNINQVAKYVNENKGISGEQLQRLDNYVFEALSFREDVSVIFSDLRQILNNWKIKNQD